MNIIPIVCFGVVALIMAVVYTVFARKTGWQGLLVRGLAILSCIALVQISANLKAIGNALPIFMTLGLAVLLLSEALKVAGINNEKTSIAVFGVLNSVGFALIACSGLALAEFNIFAVVGGILLGIAGGMLVCAIKKYKSVERVFSEIFTFMGIGFILGFGLMSMLTSSHVITSICMIGGGALLLAHRFMFAFAQKNKTVKHIADLLYILGLLVISVSIYLY